MEAVIFSKIINKDVSNILYGILNVVVNVKHGDAVIGRLNEVFPLWSAN